MTSRQLPHPYSVKIETATGRCTNVPITLLTPRQAAEVRVEFKRLAQDAGVKGARIAVRRITADDYGKVIREAKACLRDAMPKAA